MQPLSILLIATLTGVGIAAPAVGDNKLCINNNNAPGCLEEGQIWGVVEAPTKPSAATPKPTTADPEDETCDEDLDA